MVRQRGQRPFSDCWFLTGPTASGKSAIGLAVAERLGAEIVALDSMTLYRGMAIGTAKPTESERERVPHHLLDMLDPDESASVDWYLTAAERACAAIRERGRQPMFVGGTPLYLKACLRGLFEGPPANPELRRQAEEEAARLGGQVLHDRLARVDPTTAKRLHPNDVRRLVRALEVYDATGRPISEWQTEFDRPADPPPRVACIVRPRAELYRRINQRVVAMFQQGWIDEVRRLRNQYSSMSRQALQAVGYAEILEYLVGELPEAELIPLVQNRTRRFSRKQMTWFRHLAECSLIETGESEPDDLIVERVIQFFTPTRPDR